MPIKRRPVRAWSLFFIVFLFPQISARAQERIVQWSDRFLKEGLKNYSLLDRSRILKGLMYAADLDAVSGEKKNAWKDFLSDNLPSVVQDLSPSKEEEALEAAANIIEISRRHRVPGWEEKLQQWRQWALSPRFIGPDTDIRRLGLALVLLHSRPDAAALKYAETLLEAVIDGSRYENELHRFGGEAEGQALAHRLLHQVIVAPVRTVHQRRLSWMLVTHYKYLTRKAADPAPPDYHFEDALLEHGLLYHSHLHGEKLLARDPRPLELAFHYSVAARFESEKERAEDWLSRAVSRPTPRLVLTAEEWEKMIARNRTPGCADELKKTLDSAEAALALDVPVYYEPAPNIAERGRTNSLAQGVGRKLSSLRDAYLATGDQKWGKAFKDVVMAQVKQFEDYGDFRCYYNLNVPGPWDGLNAVVTYSQAYDILSPKGLLAEDEKKRLIWMVREIGHELAWTLTHSNFVVHNAWGRWMGSMGLLTSYWTDLPEAGDWRALVESRLPLLYSGIDRDGGWYEKTIAYHIFTFDLVETWFAASRKLLGVDLFDKEINERRLTMMLDWLVKITPPGGELPLFNDAQKTNLRSSAAAVRLAKILRRGDFFKAVDFLPGRPSVTEPDGPPIEWRTPDFTSVLLEESGYGIFRGGWDPDDLYFAIKFGEHGGGHGHFDKASIYVHAFGRPWLIDPGYGQRETYKHNTIAVDGRDQRPAAGKLVAWHQGETLDMVAVSHRAYEAVVHRRAVFYIKPAVLLVADVLDPLDGLVHTYDWLLQLNSNNGRPGKASWLSEAPGSGIKITFPENDPEGGREIASALNVNELPSNYQKMGNESLYLEIWRGRWTKKAAGRVVFASLIEPFRREEPRKNLTQKITRESFVLEVRDGARTHIVEWRLGDNSFTYRGRGGEKIRILPLAE